MKQIFEISPDQTGKRTDLFLAEQLPDFSRRVIQKMTKNFPNAHKLKSGEVIEIEIPDSESDSQSARDNPNRTGTLDPDIQIIFEDPDIIAVNKPRGMVMYPAAGNHDGTLVQKLLNYCPLSALGGDVRPGVAHRIDKDTSGVVILAKSDKAFRELVKTFSEHNLVRKYIAFVWNIPTWTGADIEGNIARHSRNRQKMSMVKTGGRPAKTTADVMDVWTRAGISELKCTLFTGRTHQIRVHLSSHGFPVLTDPTYGHGKESRIKPGPLLDFIRGHQGQCLHAEILELKHPITGEPLKLRAPLSDDLQLLRQLLDEY